MEEIKKEGFFTRLGKGLKYRVRKTSIAIYHNPYTVVLLLSAASMMYFTFNFHLFSYELTEGLFTTVANGFLAFLWTICAYLSVVSYLFYSGKKKNWIMFGVFMIMEIAQLYSSIFYASEGQIAFDKRIAEATEPIEPAKILATEKVIGMLKTSTVLIVITIVCAIAVIFLDSWFKKQRKAKYEARKAAKEQAK